MRRFGDGRLIDEVLPREVRARGALDDGAELRVADGRELRLHVGVERNGRRDDARLATLRRALRRLEHADAETQLVDGMTAQAKARHELRREHLQLVRPRAARDLHDEDAALQRDRLRAVGDARPDGDLPFAHGNGRPALRKTVLAGAVEEILEGLGRVELLSATPLRGPAHLPAMVAFDP